MRSRRKNNRKYIGQSAAETCEPRRELPDEALFRIVGIREMPRQEPPKPAPWYRGKPLFSALVLGVIVIGCLCCDLFLTKDPTYMDFNHCLTAPGRSFLFGTDTMGRDIFSMIWYGGRISLLIGFLSTAVSTGLAMVLGAASGLAPRWLDAVLMRFTEIFLSVPGLLLTVFLQALLKGSGIFALSLAVGLTGWPGMAKVVRAKVRQLQDCGYVIAAKCMGGGFFHVLRLHLLPNFFPSILFMIVMNIRSAILAESTLSFMGLGLPLEVISWGSMLSLSENALLSGAWWMIVIPGGFLMATLMCVTELAEYLRKNGDR